MSVSSGESSSTSLDDLRAAGANLGAALTPQAVQRLVAFEALLDKWGRTYNLTALKSAPAVRRGHLLDSLAVVGPLARVAGGRPLRVLDVGSGAGLPGVVLAVSHPDWDVTCVDAVGKKAAFVRQAAAELGLGNLHGRHARVEALDEAPFDLITARAFAALADFVHLTRRLLAPQGLWMAMKGRRPDDEIAALPTDVEAFHVEPLAVPGLDAERCLVWMRRR